MLAGKRPFGFAMTDEINALPHTPQPE